MSRRGGIPISQPPQAEAHHHRAASSSLDLVFSYARSQAAYGSNLTADLHPSFINSPHHNFNRHDSTDSQAIEDLDDLDSEQHSTRETSEDGTTSRDEVETEEDDEEGERRDGAGPSLPRRHASNSFLGEELPPNAFARRPMVHSPLGTTATTLAPPSQFEAEVNEHSTLLSRKRSLTSGSLRDRRQSLMRRFSMVSTHSTWLEDLEEVIEENKGKSTYIQTLFNLVNVLVGIGLLSTPLGKPIAFHII